TTIESLIDEMLAAMDKNLSPYYSTIKSKNLTVNELLTIASLVEKEGAKTEDRKLIAGVFYNRLNRDMPLQSNIAILYAQGKLGQNISLAEDVAIDTNIDSPYNVYKNVGLMPGPVDSPSLDAIESSIN
ncbi:aminodeoxychorismate lyase, partial [Klebsiella pneumoniae]|nr:aminodeoxychorismate lyase [Klebsiella pneumoniae]